MMHSQNAYANNAYYCVKVCGTKNIIYYYYIIFAAY